MRVIEDFDIKAKVKSLLVKYWFDTSSLNVGVHRGNVTILGFIKETSTIGRTIEEKKNMEQNLTRSDTAKTKVDFSVLKKINVLEDEIRNIEGVKSINMEFENFVQSGNTWRQK